MNKKKKLCPYDLISLTAELMHTCDYKVLQAATTVDNKGKVVELRFIVQ